MTAQVVNLVREGQRKMYATDGFINSLQLNLHLGEMLATGIGIDGRLQRLQPPVPIKQTSSHGPAVEHRQIVEQRNYNRDDGCDYRDQSLNMRGKPQGDVPLHERRSVLVKFNCARVEGIFRVGAFWKFTWTRKYPWL